MHSYAARYFMSLGNVAVSLVLGVVTFAACALLYPEVTLQLLKWAETTRARIVSLSNNPQHEIIARAVLHESSIVLMGFTIAARVVMGLLMMLLYKLVGVRRDPDF